MKKRVKTEMLSFGVEIPFEGVINIIFFKNPLNQKGRKSAELQT
jgi:hypothetical protein